MNGSGSTDNCSIGRAVKETSVNGCDGLLCCEKPLGLAM